MNNSIKAQKVKFVNPEPTLIGTVDIGKNTVFGYLQGPQGQEVKPFEFSNNINGLTKFWQKTIIASKKYGTRKIIMGFESTGTYGEPFKNFMLDKKQVDLVQVNPAHTKKMKEVVDNSPGKTDKKDPKVIASIIRLGHTLSVITPKKEAAELRALVYNRERRMGDRIADINLLESLLFKIFPEFVLAVKSIASKTALHLIEKYQTPDKLKEIDLDELIRIVRKVSRGKWGEDHARKFLWAANNSLGTKEGLPSILKEINHIIFQIKRADSVISELEKDIEYWVEKVSYAKRLLEMKGLGAITVGGIIGEVGDFGEFSTQSEILKLAGLDLYEISSGKHKGTHRISKRGRSLLRKLLYFGALNTVRKGGIFHKYYQSLLQRGKEKPKALIAVARKLLKVIFAIIRDGTDYIENHKPKPLKKVA